MDALEWLNLGHQETSDAEAGDYSAAKALIDTRERINIKSARSEAVRKEQRRFNNEYKNTAEGLGVATNEAVRNRITATNPDRTDDWRWADGEDYEYIAQQSKDIAEALTDFVDDNIHQKWVNEKRSEIYQRRTAIEKNRQKNYEKLDEYNEYAADQGFVTGSDPLAEELILKPMMMGLSTISENIGANKTYKVQGTGLSDIFFKSNARQNVLEEMRNAKTPQERREIYSDYVNNVADASILESDELDNLAFREKLLNMAISGEVERPNIKLSTKGLNDFTTKGGEYEALAGNFLSSIPEGLISNVGQVAELATPLAVGGPTSYIKGFKWLTNPAYREATTAASWFKIGMENAKAAALEYRLTQPVWRGTGHSRHLDLAALRGTEEGVAKFVYNGVEVNNDTLAVLYHAANNGIPIEQVKIEEMTLAQLETAKDTAKRLNLVDKMGNLDIYAMQKVESEVARKVMDDFKERQEAIRTRQKLAEFNATQKEINKTKQFYLDAAKQREEFERRARGEVMVEDAQKAGVEITQSQAETAIRKTPKEYKITQDMWYDKTAREASITVEEGSDFTTATRQHMSDMRDLNNTLDSVFRDPNFYLLTREEKKKVLKDIGLLDSEVSKILTSSQEADEILYDFTVANPKDFKETKSNSIIDTFIWASDHIKNITKWMANGFFPEESKEFLDWTTRGATTSSKVYFKEVSSIVDSYLNSKLFLKKAPNEKKAMYKTISMLMDIVNKNTDNIGIIFKDEGKGSNLGSYSTVFNLIKINTSNTAFSTFSERIEKEIVTVLHEATHAALVHKMRSMANEFYDFFLDTRFSGGIHEMTRDNWKSFEKYYLLKYGNSLRNTPRSLTNLKRLVRLNCILKEAQERALAAYRKDLGKNVIMSANKLYDAGYLSYAFTNIDEFVAEVFSGYNKSNYFTQGHYRTLTQMSSSYMKNKYGIDFLQDLSKEGGWFLELRNNVYDMLGLSRYQRTALDASLKDTKTLIEAPWEKYANLRDIKYGTLDINDKAKSIKLGGTYFNISPEEGAEHLNNIVRENPQAKFQLAGAIGNKELFNKKAAKIVTDYTKKDGAWPAYYQKAINEADYWAGIHNWNPTGLTAEDYFKIAGTKAAEAGGMMKRMSNTITDISEEPYNLVAQRNPAAGPATGEVRAANEQKALVAMQEGYEGIMGNTGNTPLESYLQEVLPSMSRQGVAPNPGAGFWKILSEQMVDTLGEDVIAERKALIEAIARNRNASHINLTYDGTWENWKMVLSNNTNTGFDSLSHAENALKFTAKKFEDWGITLPEVSIVVDYGDGTLRPPSPTGTYPAGAKFYHQVNHMTDLAGTMPNKGASFADLRLANETGKSAWWKRIGLGWITSPNHVFSKRFVNAGMSASEKSNGLMHRLFREDSLKMDKLLKEGANKEKISDFLMRQNIEGQLLDPSAFGLSSKDKELLSVIRNIEDKKWHLRNFNNNRALIQGGYSQFDSATGISFIGKVTSAPQNIDSELMEAGIKDIFGNDGIVADIPLESRGNYIWYKVPPNTDFGRTQFIIMPKDRDTMKMAGLTNRRINEFTDQTIRYQQGYTEMRLKDNLVYARDADGKLIGVAEDTMSIRSWARQRDLSVGLEREGGGPITTMSKGHSRTAQPTLVRNGEHLEATTNWRSFYEDPLESMQRGLRAVSENVVMDPVREQFKRDWMALYGSKLGFKDYPPIHSPEMAAIMRQSDTLSREASLHYNWANKVLFRDSSQSVWSNFMTNRANEISEWLMKNGDAGFWGEVFKNMDKWNLQQFKRDPFTWLKNQAAVASIAMSPTRQFFMQGAQGLNAIAIDFAKSKTHMSRANDLIKHVFFGKPLTKLSKENKEFFALMDQMGLISKDTNQSMIREALEAADIESKWWDMGTWKVTAKASQGAAFGERWQQFMHASALYEKAIKDNGPNYFKSKVNIDSFFRDVRVITGGQSPFMRMNWEDGIAGSFFQFCQSPYKNLTSLMDTQLPANMRKKIIANQAAMFGFGKPIKLWAAMVAAGIAGSDSNPLPEEVNSLIEMGLAGAVFNIAAGRPIDLNSMSPSNAWDIVVAANDLSAQVGIGGFLPGVDTKKELTNFKQILQDGVLQRFPAYSFAVGKLMPTVASLIELGIKDPIDLIKDKKVDWAGDCLELLKNVVSIPSQGANAVKALSMLYTGRWVSKNGTHIHASDLSPRTALFQALGFSPISDKELDPTSYELSRMTLMQEDPEKFMNSDKNIKDATDAVMVYLQNQYGDVRNWDYKQHAQRQLEAFNVLLSTWCDGDKTKVYKIRKHIEAQINKLNEVAPKKGEPGYASAYVWLHDIIKNENKEFSSQRMEAMSLFKEHFPNEYARLEKTLSAVEGYDDEEYRALYKKEVKPREYHKSPPQAFLEEKGYVPKRKVKKHRPKDDFPNKPKSRKEKFIEENF